MMLALRNLVSVRVRPCSECNWDSGKRSLGWSTFSPGFYVQNSRLCTPQCLERYLSKQVLRMQRPDQQPSASPKLPLGLLLLEQGAITEAQLRRALEQQSRKEPGRRLGEILRETAGLQELDIALGVARQWSVPFAEIAVADAARGPDFWSLLPQALSQLHRALIIHADPVLKTGYLAFADGVKHSVLYAVEQITGYSIRPCIARDSQMEVALETYAARARTHEIVVDGPISARDIVGMIGSYAANTEAKSIRLARCAQHVWARLEGEDKGKGKDKETWHLVLRLMSSPAKVLPFGSRN